MFVLAEMKHVVNIHPRLFNLKLNDAIAGELNKKLANKVVLNVGLCIALHDIVSIAESYIIPSDGASHTPVTFRYVVFRPLPQEILTGKIKSCTEKGVHVSLGFFDDILIPKDSLQYPSKFNETEQVWVWEYDEGDGNKHDLFMDLGEAIQFRVISESFSEASPTNISESQNKSVENKLSYSLTGSINESGLGLLSWWNT